MIERVGSRGADEHLARADEHHARATSASNARTQRDSTGVTVHYESAAALRDTMREHELAQESWRAAQHCAALRNRALTRAYQHRCVIELIGADNNAGKGSPLRCVRVAQHEALRQVRDTDALREREHQQPPLLNTRPLATCAASNAPGSVLSVCAYARDHRRSVAGNLYTENDTT